MSRRWRYPRSRRGSFYRVVSGGLAPAQPSFPPAFQEPSGRNARLAAVRTRRGKFGPIVQAVVAVTSAFVPAIQEPAGRNSRLAGMRVRRGGFLPIPASQQVPVQQRRVPRYQSAVRRGRFFAVPLIGMAPAVAPWVPPLLDIRRAPARPARRGRFFTVPLAGLAPAPPAVVPQFTRERTRIGYVRRGRYWSPPVQQITAAPTWAPPVTRARRPLAAPVRRGEYQAVPSRVPCPHRITSRRSQPLWRTHGRTWTPPWGFVPPAGPGPYIAKMITATRRAPSRPTRRGVFIEPVWPQILPSAGTASAGAMNVPAASPASSQMPSAVGVAERTPSALLAQGAAPTASPATGIAPTATGG